MLQRAISLLFCCVAAILAPVLAQQVLPVVQEPVRHDQPGLVLPYIYGTTGLTLAPSQIETPPGSGIFVPHQAHFHAGAEQTIGAFNAAIATQLSLLPIPSPASGFIYHEDPTTGLATRSSQSLGPIFTERAETIGRHKTYFGVAYQRFNFSTLDGMKLNSFPAVFLHQSNPTSKDVIQSSNSIDLEMNQTILFFTVGLLDRLDVSVALPITNVSTSVGSDLTIQRIQTLGNFLTHTFVVNQNAPQANFRDSGSATGIGDVVFRFKGTLFSTRHLAAALATDLRAPSGDAKSFLGTGAWGVRPFLAISIPGIFSPHANIGYQINGSSILTGSVKDFGTENNPNFQLTKGHLPNNFFYAFGTDIGATKRLTLAFDILGARVFSTDRLESNWFYDANAQQFVTSASGANVFPTIRAFPNQSLSIDNAAVGFKYNLASQLLLTANVLLKLDNGGLRQRAIPLVGLSYTFR